MTAPPQLRETWQKAALGDTLAFDGGFVFFGKRGSSQEALEREYPDWKFWPLQQTHSDLVVTSPYSGTPPQADAHITRERGHALCVRTADCVPVLILCPQHKIAAAVHAGWRGIENEIILKTSTRLHAEMGLAADEPFPPSMSAVIGPHIGARSFEVGLDVAERLNRRFQIARENLPRTESVLEQVVTGHSDPSKAYVNLLDIVHTQLLRAGFKPSHIFSHVIDTFASEEHESFRRDREHAGRQLSFVVLT